MLLTERPPTDLAARSATECDVQVRLNGGTRDREIIHLTPGNYSVGSGPKCSVRLRDAGVGPMHCLIIRDDAGVRVRRWSNETLLNGQPFSEAALAGGDHLSIGPIDLEMISPACDDDVLPMAEPIHEDVEPVADEVVEAEARQLDDSMTPSSEWIYGSDVWDEDTEDDPDFFEFDELPASSGGIEEPSRSRPESGPEGGIEAAGIGVRILSALESQRAQFDELLSRVDDLEQKVELALAEGTEAGHQLMPQSSQEDELTALAADFAQSSSTYFGQSRESELFGKANSGLAWASERSELVTRNTHLEADLTLAQQQLADSLAELSDAQATIDDLQARLADSQRSWQESSDERAACQQQLDVLESQLATLESQLATHAAEAEQLRGQLHDLQVSAEETNAASTASADPGELQDEVAEPFDDLGAESSHVAINEAAPEFDWTTQAESYTEPEASEVGDDWSAKSPKAFVAAEDATAAESGPEAVESWPTQAVWPFDNNADVTSDDSVEPADEAVHSAEPETAAAWVDATPTAEPPMVAEAVAPKRESGSRLSGDIGEALAHLRELSLWRKVRESSTDAVAKETVAEPDQCNVAAAEEAEVEVENHPSETAAVVEPMPVLPEAQAQVEGAIPEPETEPVEVLAATEAVADAEPTIAKAPASFIERYAHMVEGEDRKEVAPAAAPAPSLKDIMERSPNRVVPASTATTTDETSASGDSDESIEKYMARMMQRIRGDAPSGTSTVAAAAGPTESKAHANGGSNYPKVATQIAANPTVAADTSIGTTNSELLINLQDMKRKEPTPEFSTDMGALRALANQTARHAIGIHTTRTLRRNAATRFIICLLAGTTTAYFLLNADGWQSYEFATACVSLAVALYWGRMTFVSLIKAVRVGAFDDLGSEFAPVDSANLPLPIDVRR